MSSRAHFVVVGRGRGIQGGASAWLFAPSPFLFKVHVKEEMGVLGLSKHRVD